MSRKKSVNYRILNHRLMPVSYPVTYESVEFVKDPDGNKIRNRHGQFETRDIEEAKNRIGVRYTFLVDSGVDERWMTTPELVNLSGKRKYRDELRIYKRRLKDEWEGNQEINEPFRAELDRFKEALNV